MGKVLGSEGVCILQCSRRECYQQITLQAVVERQFHPQSTQKKELSPKDCSPFLLCDIDLNEGVIRQKITARGLATYTHPQQNMKKAGEGRGEKEMEMKDKDEELT